MTTIIKYLVEYLYFTNVRVIFYGSSLAYSHMICITLLLTGLEIRSKDSTPFAHSFGERQGRTLICGPFSAVAEEGQGPFEIAFIFS